jgi:hypothetical protein
MREISSEVDAPPGDLPEEVSSFVVPVPYDALAFGLHSHGLGGRCSYCLEQAETMAPGGNAPRYGKRRWLAFCSEHDRHRRWVRDSWSGSWWYLPPPEDNRWEHWWKLAFSVSGLAGGDTGWHLSKATGETVVDLGTTKLHRARALAERYFAMHD